MPAWQTESRRWPSILIVEDDDSTSELLGELFVLEGFTVEVEPLGGPVLSHLASGRFDLVLLDLRLPDVSGLTACRRIRGWEAEQATALRTPIVVLSATVSGDVAANCRRAGADEYVAKPFDVDALLATVHQWADLARQPGGATTGGPAGVARLPGPSKESHLCR